MAADPGRAGGSLLAFSFIYGVLHALGPGHGKVVIATWLATHPSKLKSGIRLTLAASLLQGLVAIALVVVVLTLLALPARQMHLSSFWLEKGSYALVGLLGVMLCWRALKKLRDVLRRPTFKSFTPPPRPPCKLRLRPSAYARAGQPGGRGRLAGQAGYRALNGDAALFGRHYGAAVQ
ncbi:High-affinity nickel-transport protein [Pluralibacter gergoviae]|nr:High-affinity nickel-transport protein [Pluralibacter gergoviae]